MKWLVITAALAFAGCNKKKSEPAPSTPPPGSAVAVGSATAPETPAGSAAAAGSAAVDVPTEQDFEAQAGSDITDKNVNDKLKSLEGDLTTQ